MKILKKFINVLIAAIMITTMVIPAFAQDITVEGNGPATITINNASKGETYSVYKVFDATYNTTTGAIAYTYNGTLQENDYFTQDAATGAITATDKAKDSAGELNEDATEWIKDNLQPTTAVADAVSDGSVLKFTGLDYGYYLVTSTLNGGALVAVNSTTPDAVMNDKNTGKPGWDPEQPGGGKAIVNGDTTTDTIDANIGDTVTFKIAIKTQNYVEDKKIQNYVIGDTFPEGQDFIEIQSVTVNGDSITYTSTNSGFPITVQWIDADGNSLYKAGDKLVVTYTAKLNEKAVIDGVGNVNTATFTYNYYNHDNPENPDPSNETQTDTATTYTYALGFKKVAEDATPLDGAQFALPFKVSVVSGEDNTYVVDSVNGTNTVTTDSTGLIIIKGVKAGDYEIEETKAPAGYNKLAEKFTVTAAKTGVSTTTTTITKYLDEKGDITDTTTERVVSYEAGSISISDFKVVVNKKGAELPSTGGTGTVMFYIIGVIMVIGAGVVLIARRRMGVRK